MDWQLEVVVVPVSDIDRARAFYADQLWFVVDHDTRMGEDVRVVQLTPPRSGCSVVIGTGLPSMEMPPGSLRGLQLVVPDIHAAHAHLVERGVEVSEILVADRTGLRPVREGDVLHNVGFVFFSDPDGNQWAVQQIDRPGWASVSPRRAALGRPREAGRAGPEMTIGSEVLRGPLDAVK
ncbi:VOC family protein [soil metagenome]